MSKKPTLRDVVREAIRDMLREELADMVEQPDATIRNHELDDESEHDRTMAYGRDRDDRADRRRTRETESETPAPRRRRRIRRGPRVNYTVKRGARTGKALTPKNMPAGNVETVWEWLQDNEPATARQIEKGTGLKQKATESAIHWLRTNGAVESNDINGDE